MTGWKVIERAECRIANALVKAARLECERVEPRPYTAPALRLLLRLPHQLPSQAAAAQGLRHHQRPSASFMSGVTINEKCAIESQATSQEEWRRAIRTCHVK
jgi:hypothetical protein